MVYQSETLGCRTGFEPAPRESQSRMLPLHQRHHENGGEREQSKPSAGAPSRFPSGARGPRGFLLQKDGTGDQGLKSPVPSAPGIGPCGASPRGTSFSYSVFKDLLLRVDRERIELSSPGCKPGMLPLSPTAQKLDRLSGLSPSSVGLSSLDRAAFPSWRRARRIERPPFRVPRGSDPVADLSAVASPFSPC